MSLLESPQPPVGFPESPGAALPDAFARRPCVRCGRKRRDEADGLGRAPMRSARPITIRRGAVPPPFAPCPARGRLRPAATTGRRSGHCCPVCSPAAGGCRAARAALRTC